MQKKGTPSHPSAAGLAQAGHRASSIIRKTLITMALGMFGAAGALAVVQPADGNLPVIQQARQILPLPESFHASLAAEPSAESSPFIQTTQIRRGDTLADVLQRLNVSESGLLPFLTHDKSARSVYKLYPGRSFHAGLDSEGSLAWLRYNHTPSAIEDGQTVSKWLEIKPDGKGGFSASEEFAAADTEIRVSEGTIVNSLFGATDAAGIPDSITMQMTDILGSKVDFLRDIRQGDTFRIVYETYSHQGQSVGSGRILGIEFTNGSRTHEAIWFKPENGSGGYYDFKGNSLRAAFLRAPLKFTRVSSTFGTRKHPVHGYTAQHKGIDYAAPSGTPIHSTSDGTVEFIGWQRGYGNVVIIKHHGKYSTVYAHQSRFAKSLKKGDSVEQGQLIGYVGATGWATGPHLHYEIRVDGKQLNPQSVDLPIASTLEGGDRLAFNKVSSQYQGHFQLLASARAIPGETAQVASR